MARRNDHSREEIKQLALDAAEQLLQEEGATGLSARKVAARIGYTAGSLYQVFANLDDLCWQINVRTLWRLNHILAQHSVCDASEQLHHLAYDYVAFAKQNPALWSLLFDHCPMSDTPLPPALNAQIDQLFSRLEYPLSQLNPQKQPDQVHCAARAIWSGVHGMTVLALRDKLFLQGKTAEQAILNSLLDSFLQGWKAGDL